MEFSSKLEERGDSGQHGGLKNNQADWAGAKGFREKGMTGEAHQELIRWRWTERDRRKSKGTMERT